MSPSRFLGVAILLTVTTLWLLAAPAGGGPGGHLSNSRCQDCHLADKVDAKNGSLLVTTQEKMCVQCHANAVRLSHPSGFFPKRALAAQFPLDWKGTLTCSSCHTIHASGAGLLRSTQRGPAFCHECHDAKFFEAMADRGTSVTLSGHLDTRKQTEAVTLSLDAFTVQCLGCHSDQEGGDRRVGINMGGVLQHNKSSMNHPIGVNYEQTVRQGGYHPLTRLPPEILLPDGNVGCISCHEGYSGRHGKLVKSNAGSGLCLTCHDL
ncbi:MAG: cytochrome c3 family protein [Magnetococcus sp. YQC-3]